MINERICLVSLLLIEIRQSTHALCNKLLSILNQMFSMDIFSTKERTDISLICVPFVHSPNQLQLNQHNQLHRKKLYLAAIRNSLTRSEYRCPQ